MFIQLVPCCLVLDFCLHNYLYHQINEFSVTIIVHNYINYSHTACKMRSETLPILNMLSGRCFIDKCN